MSDSDRFPAGEVPPSREQARTTVQGGIARLRSRWVAVSFLEGTLRALFYVLLLAAAALLFLDVSPLFALAVVGVASLAYGGARTLASRPAPSALAKRYDDCVDLKDRISSSIELLSAQGPMVDALLEEAAGAAARVEPARAFPYRLPREGRWLPAAALLVVAVVFLPNLGANPGRDPLLEEALHQGSQSIEEIISREMAKDPTKRREDILAELKKLSGELQREKLSKKDAMAELAKMLEKLEQEREKELQKKRDLEELLKSLNAGDKRRKEIADPMQRGDYQDALNKLQELIDELQKKIDKAREEGDKEKLEQLEEELKRLQELKAKLLKMLQMDLDLSMMSEVIDFLADFEGDLADITEMVKGVPFVKPDCKCDKPGL